MNLSKAPWTQEEDEILVQVINDKGPKKWKEIAIELNKRLGNLKVFRQGKQCRERWINHLDPTINRYLILAKYINIKIEEHGLAKKI